MTYDPDSNPKSLDREQLRLLVRRRGLGGGDFHAVHEIIGLCRKDVPLSEIKTKVEPLPMLGLMLCRAASSAEYGASSVNSLLYALELLGPKGIRSACLGAMFKSGPADFGKMKFVNVEQVSYRCLAMGLLVKAMARTREKVDPDLAFTAGLFTDVGYLVWSRFVPVLMDKIAATALHTPGVSIVDVETTLMKYSHAEAGETIANELHLDPIIQGAIAGHLEPSLCSEEHIELADLCHMASWTLDRLDIPVIKGLPRDELDPFILHRVAFKLDALEEMVNETRNSLAQMTLS